MGLHQSGQREAGRKWGQKEQGARQDWALQPQSGSVWLELRVGWKLLETTEWGREGALLFPANNLNHLQVVTITNPWVFWSFYKALL